MTTRVKRGVPRLRNNKRYQIIRRATLVVTGRRGFRICEFFIQRDHLHLVCEAESQAALAAGMRRFKQRVAFGLNGALGRRGPVFLDRYHFEVLQSPRKTRHALSYVLLNARKHGETLPAGYGDPYSSGYWFSGWKRDEWKTGVPPPEGGPCVSTPRTWLLREGWRRHGLLHTDEVPGKPARRKSTCGWGGLHDHSAGSV